MNMAFIVIPHYFNRRRNIANSIMSAGMSTSHMVMPLLITYLHEEYGYRGGTLILGAFILNVCAAAMVLHPVAWHTHAANYTKITTNTNKNDKKLTSRKSECKSGGCLKRLISTAVDNLHYIKSPRIFQIAAQIALQCTLLFNVFSLIPFAMLKEGFSQQESSFCMAMAGTFNLGSRFLTALLACCPTLRVFYVFLFGIAITTVSLLGMACQRLANFL